LERGPDGAPQPVPKEHFGFFDGIGDPVFEGQLPDDAECLRVVGNGKIGTDGIWQPLATGEFLLGYPDEAQEIAGFGMPISFSRNGTFMAYRKLHQNVAAFRDYVARTSLRFGQVFGIDDPDDAREAFLAKMSGRWSDGVPVVRAPTIEAWRAFNERFPFPKPGDQAAENRRTQALSDYVFRDDPIGAKCPLTAHVRRANPRDMLDPLGNSEDPKLRNGSVLNNRRRILRRGLPYGSAAPDETDDGSEHGIVMLNVCASLFRQFEFVQQQWMNYGLDFNAGSDSCPLVGNHDKEAKFVIPADPESGHPPFIAADLPQFVETRGGAYFFVPSITALGMIGMGVVDPT
jgi:Dyp-type peroxidase family